MKPDVVLSWIMAVGMLAGSSGPSAAQTVADYRGSNSSVDGPLPDLYCIDLYPTPAAEGARGIVRMPTVRGAFCPEDHFDRLAEVDIDGSEVRKTIELMVEKGVGMSSTQAVYELYLPGRPPLEQRVLDAMSDEVRTEYLEDTSDERALRLGEELFKKAQRFEYLFDEADGTLAAGVDPTGYGDQRNYELLLESGFSPPETIRIMTLNGASILDIDDELGSIETGKIADLVVIDGDPVASPTDIRNVVYVFKDGRGYDSARLVKSIQGTVGIR